MSKSSVDRDMFEKYLKSCPLHRLRYAPLAQGYCSNPANISQTAKEPSQAETSRLILSAHLLSRSQVVVTEAGWLCRRSVRISPARPVWDLESVCKTCFDGVDRSLVSVRGWSVSEIAEEQCSVVARQDYGGRAASNYLALESSCRNCY